jgi:glutaredoxin
MTDLAGLADPDIVVVYGLDTCDDTTRARRHFEGAGLPFRYVRLDQDHEARSRVHAAGYFATPVVVTPGGRLSVEPEDDELGAIVVAVLGSTA